MSGKPIWWCIILFVLFSALAIINPIFIIIAICFLIMAAIFGIIQNKKIKKAEQEIYKMIKMSANESTNSFEDGESDE